jgi:hypothetical protein
MSSYRKISLKYHAARGFAVSFASSREKAAYLLPGEKISSVLSANPSADDPVGMC